MTAWLLVAQLAVPNPDLTPGAVRPLTTQQICSTRWGLDHRHVPVTMRKHVFAAYGIPWARRSAFVLDHLVPRALGGKDDVLDLFPQPVAEARLKDRLEVKLHKMTCAGTISLAKAQKAFADWPAAYRRYIGELPIPR